MKFVQSVFYFFRIFLASLRAIIDANPNASGERSALRMAAAAFVRHEQSYSVQPDPGPCIKKNNPVDCCSEEPAGSKTEVKGNALNLQYLRTFFLEPYPKKI